jgi:hypothetical protein
MAGLNNVNSIDKVFCNRAPRDEAGLVRVHKAGNELSETKGETFRMDLEATVLEGDGAEILRYIKIKLSCKL